MGVVLNAKVGARVQAGDPLCALHAADEGAARRAAQRIQAAYTIGTDEVAPLPIMLDRITEA